MYVPHFEEACFSLCLVFAIGAVGLILLLFLNTFMTLGSTEDQPNSLEMADFFLMGPDFRRINGTKFFCLGPS